MKSLDIKQQKIVAIAANTAVGNLSTLRTELNAGLDAGLTVNQIKEILVQMYAYCGFPRSLQGINTFMAVMDDRKAKGINDEMGQDVSPITDTREKYLRGRKILEELTRTSQANISGANAFVPAIDVFLKEHLFADIFERDVLTYQERELATISALAAMQGVEPMLQSHLNMGMNTGLSREQLEETLTIVGRFTRKEREETGRGLLAVVVENKTALFPLGERGLADWFTGEVYVQGLLTPDQIEGLYSVGQVTFEPGGRTYWHTHPIGQVLLVTGGKGFYQERGKPAQILTKGSVVAIPKDVEHWHGASADTGLVHIAISNIADGSAVTWMEPVNEKEYEEVNQ
ncbi:MAG: carboxymuconolactone decarboxylase family protein [Tannerella sp.]|nr:carboxymuconolactone decarboxylase family protein [Tannerella sp.]